MKNIFLGALFLILCSKVMAQKSNQRFVEEAEAYCALFQLDFWQALENEGLDAPEKLNRFRALFRANIKSDAFYAITSNIPLDGYDPKKIYSYLREKITALIGEPYHCPAIYTYYDELFKHQKD